ncbi:O-antigen ligase family protein [Candidatus Woesebacteria bacterium]|nr:O-antigen ligase family protein [Candidatus Woesebacteria bacterium]
MIDTYLRKATLWLFHFWLLVVPFVFTAVNDELFEFNKMIFTYAIAVIVTTLWIARMIWKKEIIWQSTILFWPIMAYAASHLLATAFSVHPHTSIFGYYSRFHGGLLSTLTYISLFFAFINTVRHEELRALIRTSLVATIGVSLYAIPEHFGVSPSCILITGEFSVGCWVQDVQTRVFATFGQPNWLAAYILMMLPLAWWYLAGAWQAWRHQQEKTDTLIHTKTSNATSLPTVALADITLGASALILGTITLLYTRSRSGFLGLAAEIGFLFVSIMFIWWRKRHQASLAHWKQSLFPVLTGSLTAIVLSIGILGSPFTPSVGELIQRIVPTNAEVSETTPSTAPTTTPAPTTGTVLENGGTDSGAIRRIVWEGAVRVWQRYPLFGSGLDTFAYSYYQDRPLEHNQVSEWDFLYNRAHNEFLNILATTGIIGFGATLLLMGVFIFAVLRDIWTLSGEDATDLTSSGNIQSDSVTDLPLIFFLALLAGYGGLAISNFFGFSTVVVGALFFLYKAWWEILRQPATPPEKQNSLNATSTPSKTHKKETKKHKSTYVTQKKSSAHKTKRLTSNAAKNQEFTWDKRSWALLGVGITALFLLMRIWGMWRHDVQLATSKAYLAQGQGYSAYVTITDLVKKAPLEPTFVDQQAVTLARLAAGTYSQDATTAAQLADEAVNASNRAVQLNPVHVNFWKNRARVFIMLATIDQRYYVQALESLHRGRELAPTDVKLLYNIALVLDALQETDQAREAYQDTLALKPDYEDARNSYADFLERQQDYAAAAEQYRYILENLNPTAQPPPKNSTPSPPP